MKLAPTKQKLNDKAIYAFDIETFDDNKKFLMASIVGENGYSEFFANPESLRKAFLHPRFKHSIVFATNLSFDLFGTFFGSEDMKKFNLLMRGSKCIEAKTYITKDGFVKKSHHKNSISFLDTKNFGDLTVEQMGECIGIQKLKQANNFNVDEMIGKYYSPSDLEYQAMKTYNLQDSLISFEFMKFFIKTLEDLGGTFKRTIASCSLRLFKDNYLHETYYRMPMNMLDFIFESYHGGNVHAYYRGRIGKSAVNPDGYFLYDYNSLYPAMMKKYSVPNPNNWRFNSLNELKYIYDYDGISEVTVSAPELFYPYLCVKHNNKLIFPEGTFKGVFTNFELRECLKYGYKILVVHKNLYFLDNIRLFDGFVTDLYDKRLAFKETHNPAQLIVKILMNSLYGKFGEKFRGKDNILCDPTIEELSKYEFNEPLSNGFVRVKNEISLPASHCMPIWATYITAYARDTLYHDILLYDAVYCDTDSIITPYKIGDSKELGKLKLEAQISEGILVKPKFYYYEGISFSNGKKLLVAKIKGLGMKVDKQTFFKVLEGNTINYKKFCKLREALRRGFLPNEIIDISKTFNLEDDKRSWEMPFSHFNLQKSAPLHLELLADYNVVLNENMRAMPVRFSKPELMSLAGQDFFDKKGQDISKKEFFDNEIGFAAEKFK